MTIAENLKRIRKERGLTQKQVGELCGMSEVQIRQYERIGSNPKIETIERIANGLGVSVWALMPSPDPREIAESEGFDSYIKSIGFSLDVNVTKFHYDMVDDQPEPFRVPDDFEYVLLKDNCSVTLTPDELLDLRDHTKDYIEGWFYKKAADQKKGGK